MSEPAPTPAGVIIWTESSRFATLANFYEHTLGLEPATRRPDHVSFEFGAFRLTIGVHDEVWGRATDPLRLMINLAVEDIAESFMRLQKLGVPFTRPPESESWGGRIATLSDPDGNTIQLLQLP
ncbi:MAG: VOC family protein [Acidimicrobiia bacterium]|nr:VOC family protein [Acidimicrobiia bacterium]